MIYQIKGILIEKQPGFAALDTNGVAYEILISLSTFAKLPDIGSEVSLFTYMVVSENNIYIVGFSSLEEKRLFLSLITVSGIGPKLAIKILGGIGVDKIRQAIASSDSPSLISIPGVGKKMAERMIVELKDKFANFDAQNGTPSTGAKADVVSALVNLGYREQDALKAVEPLSTDSDFETILKEALKALSHTK